MGSSSREALVESKRLLATLGAKKESVGASLLAAARAIDGSGQLRSFLTDPGATPEDKGRVVGKVFVAADATAVALLAGMSAERWSDAKEFVAGVEEIGFRALAVAGDGESIERELFAFETAVRSDAQLELAVSSKLGGPDAKIALVETLLTNASPATRTVVTHLVRSARGRRIGPLLRRTAAIVADQAGLGIATVSTAVPLTAEQLKRLEGVLGVRYGRKLSINQVIDETLIGGVRISVGDDVIDGSVATRLSDLRLQLAG
ncbi:MAG: synthase subunit delta [Naasia sp.]|nr:synthase subunit delta [Naasia sp.]